MDAPFDIEGARALLHAVAEEKADGLSLSSVMQVTKRMDGMKVVQVEHPTRWRLLREESDGSQEELVFTVRGVITAKDLPPILQRPRVSSARYKYLRQGITITGFATPAFEKAMATASEIYGMFDQSFADGQMESWSPSSSPSLEG